MPVPEAPRPPRPSRGRVFRDPVYGNITVDHPALVDVIDAPDFQRLRRIHQLGMCHAVYYGAEHSRFQHSIGAMWLMHRILRHWQERRTVEMPDDLALSATLAALLHDVGHGPFSHALETVFTDIQHEQIGARIIEERLGDLLASHGVDVSQVLAILRGTAGKPFLTELISSQVDVDRMDYLLRDSLYTGVKYGLFDIDRMIYTLTPVSATGQPNDPCSVLAIQAKGIHAAEEYIFSRYSMYWQVYFHKTIRSAEVLLKTVLRRAHEVALHERHRLLVPPNMEFMYEPATARSPAEWLEAFVAVDDTDLYHAIKLWQKSGDGVLRDLADRFINRRFYKALPAPDDAHRCEAVRDLVRSRHGEAVDYYFHLDHPTDAAYDYYKAQEGKPVIRVVTRPPDGWEEISEVTQTQAVRALARIVTRAYLLVPEDCAEQAHVIVAG